MQSFKSKKINNVENFETIQFVVFIIQKLTTKNILKMLNTQQKLLDIG